MPTIHLENCTLCLKCVKDCPASAIDIHAGSIAATCIHCGHCVAICPESTIEPDQGQITPLKPAKISARDFEEFSAGLRSTRYYLKKEVAEETIEALIDNMKHYASASNARPIRITLVRSPEKIQELNDLTLDSIINPLKKVTSPFLKPLMKIFVPSVNVARLGLYKESFIQKRKTNSSVVCHHAPLVMLFHGPIAKFSMTEADANIWATNTSMYAKTLGLGSCFIGFIVKAMERNKKLREKMGIPSGHKVYAALILGYPKVNYKNEASRRRPKVTIV
ncbi:nitroreductase family protein [Bacteroidota bacterium]